MELEIAFLVVGSLYGKSSMPLNGLRKF